MAIGTNIALPEMLKCGYDKRMVTGVIQAGDGVGYGVLYTITTCQIAYMTSPFGYNLFLMKAMASKEITLIDIYSSIVPFVIIMLLGLALVMLFPQIAMWLPEFYYAK